jgi:quinol monooxygenase YgiN
LVDNNVVVLEVHMEAAPGQEKELEEQLSALLAPTREEPGCLAYELQNDPEDRRSFLFYEKFKDQAALDAHLATAHFQRFAAFRNQGSDPVAQVTVTRWKSVI